MLLHKGKIAMKLNDHMRKRIFDQGCQDVDDILWYYTWDQVQGQLLRQFHAQLCEQVKEELRQ